VRSFSFLLVLSLSTLPLTLACSSSGSASPDAGPGSAGAVPDSGAAAGAEGGAQASPDGSDAPEAAPFAGRHAYNVRSTLDITGALKPSTYPASHSFTLVLDGDAGTASFSSAEGGGTGTLKQPDEYGNMSIIPSVDKPIAFTLAACTECSVSYFTIYVRVSSTGTLTGGAGGNASWVSGDERLGGGGNMTFEGEPTQLPP